MGFNHLLICYILALCLDKITMDCQDVFNNLPKSMLISESYTAGTPLQNVTADIDIKLVTTVLSPSGLKDTLKNHFKFVQVTATTKQLVLQNTIDIEDIYNTKNIPLEHVLLKIDCSSNTDANHSMMNITVEDVDDNGPVFDDITSDSCILPVLTASVSLDFIGQIETSPSCLCASDGDVFINNSITYSFIHGDPIEYLNYFVINTVSGAINKTANISSTGTFIFVIEAQEVSALKRNKVAVVSIGVTGGTSVTITEVHEANSTALLVLRILSAVILVGFTVGFALLIRHRNTIVRPKEINEIIKDKYKEDDKTVDNVQHRDDIKTEWTLETIDEELELTTL